MSETRIALANWKECAIASISIYICRGRKYIYTKKKKTAIYRGPCCCWFLFYTTVCMMASLLLAWLHHNRRSLYTSPGGSVPSISISLYVYNINMLLYIHDGVCCCVCRRWSGHVEKRRDGRCAAPTIDDEGRSQQNIITSCYRYWFVGCSAGVLLYVAATVFLPTLLDDDGFLFA